MKNSIFILAAVFMLSLVFFSCGGQQNRQVDLAQVRQAIESNNAKFVDAFNQGDAAAVAALYTQDATLMPPNSEMIRGKEGVQDFWNQLIQSGVKDVALTTVTVQGGHSLVYEIGTYSLKIQAQGQTAGEDSGKYVVLWKRQDDGTWKLQADIWNSSLPAPGQEVTHK
ncbi:MAG: YybH family protein [bacterium]